MMFCPMVCTPCAAFCTVCCWEVVNSVDCIVVGALMPIFENNAEKRFLHSSSLRACDKVRELAPYPIQHVEIPWG